MMKEYIDKQELLKELRDDLENDCNVYCDNFDRIMRDRKYEFAIDVVQDATVADVKEVVHAKWKQSGKYDDNDNVWFECSNCGHSDLHSKNTTVPYCWYCGATMSN